MSIVYLFYTCFMTLDIEIVSKGTAKLTSIPTNTPIPVFQMSTPSVEVFFCIWSIVLCYGFETKTNKQTKHGATKRNAILHGQLPSVTCGVYLWIAEDLKIKFIKMKIFFLHKKIKKKKQKFEKDKNMKI